jgi:predicted AAA+ superfamily ATPase
MPAKMEIISRFIKAPKASFFLFGPRGTGKSTWVKGRFPKAVRLDLLDPPTHTLYAAHPERLRALVEGHSGQTTFIIDEVQKVPALLDVVHLLLEENKGGRFVLTGSSARKLKRAGTNLLAGRALRCTMHPFMAAEIGSSFTLAGALKEGLLPVVWRSQDPRQTLSAYIALYIREEVQMEGLVRQIGPFIRFLEAASFSHASLLNVSHVARECLVERKTVQGYLQVLEDLHLSFSLPVFTKRAKRDLISHSKFYYFDAGVFRALRPAGPLDRESEIDGQALEGLVAQHLRAWNAYDGDAHTLHYWHTRWGLEVDFVVYGPREFTAIEVKNSSAVRSEDLRALREFQVDYPEAKLILLYRGKDRLKFGPILCLPCEDFLKTLIPGRPLCVA